MKMALENLPGAPTSQRSSEWGVNEVLSWLFRWPPIHGADETSACPVPRRIHHPFGRIRQNDLAEFFTSRFVPGCDP